MKKIDDKKKLYYMLVGISVLIPLVLSFSYAYFQARIIDNSDNFSGGSTDTYDIDLLTENDGYINSKDMLLIKTEDIETKSQKGKFKVVSGNNKNDITYSISLSNITISNNLLSEDFKWTIIKLPQKNTIAQGNFKDVTGNSMTLIKDLEINPNKTDEYELRIWIEETEDNQLNLMNKAFSAKISISSEMSQ